MPKIWKNALALITNKKHDFFWNKLECTKLHAIWHFLNFYMHGEKLDPSVKVHACGAPRVCGAHSPKSGRMLCHWFFFTRNLTCLHMQHTKGRTLQEVTRFYELPNWLKQCSEGHQTRQEPCQTLVFLRYQYIKDQSLCLLNEDKIYPTSLPMWDKHCYIFWISYKRRSTFQIIG